MESPGPCSPGARPPHSRQAQSQRGGGPGQEADGLPCAPQGSGSASTGWPSSQAPGTLLGSRAQGPADQILPPPSCPSFPTIPSPRGPSPPISLILCHLTQAPPQLGSAQSPTEAQKWTESFIEGPTSQTRREDGLAVPRSELQAHPLPPVPRAAELRSKPCQWCAGGPREPSLVF